MPRTATTSGWAGEGQGRVAPPGRGRRRKKSHGWTKMETQQITRMGPLGRDLSPSWTHSSDLFPSTGKHIFACPIRPLLCLCYPLPPRPSTDYLLCICYFRHTPIFHPQRLTVPSAQSEPAQQEKEVKAEGKRKTRRKKVKNTHLFSFLLLYQLKWFAGHGKGYSEGRRY